MIAMNISENGIALIKKFEGLELHAYKPVPQETYFTIGYGHYGHDVKAGQVITEAQADAFLRSDLATAVTGVNGLVKVPLNQNEFDALVSFAFNCGYQALKGSSLLADLNAKNYAGAGQEFGKWIHGAGGVILQGLVDRREAEKELFLKPVPQPPKELFHTVVSGDTLTKIAKNNSLTLAQIEALNKGIDYNLLQIGQRIRVK